MKGDLSGALLKPGRGWGMVGGGGGGGSGDETRFRAQCPAKSFERENSKWPFLTCVEAAA